MNGNIIDILKKKLADSETEVRHLRTVCAELQADLDKCKPLALKNTGSRTAVYPDWDLVNQHPKKVVANLMHDDFKPVVKSAFYLAAKYDDATELFSVLTDSARDLCDRGEII